MVICQIMNRCFKPGSQWGDRWTELNSVQIDRVDEICPNVDRVDQLCPFRHN